MPTLSDLRRRFTQKADPLTTSMDVRDSESLVFDGRSRLTPKQQVESKLRRALTQMEERAALNLLRLSSR